MKMDMANFAVSSIRPKLMQQSAEYERKKFQEFLEKQPSMTLFLSFFPSDLPVKCVSLLVDHEKNSDVFISSRIHMVNDSLYPKTMVRKICQNNNSAIGTFSLISIQRRA